MSIAATAKPGTLEEDGVAVLALLQHIATVSANPVWLSDAADAAVRVAELLWPEVNAFIASTDSVNTAPDTLPAMGNLDPLFPPSQHAGIAGPNEPSAAMNPRPKRLISRSQIQETLAAAMLFAVRQQTAVDPPHLNAKLWLESLQGQITMRLVASEALSSMASGESNPSTVTKTSGKATPRKATIALALATVSVVAPLAARLGHIKSSHDLHTFFLDMDGRRGGTSQVNRNRSGGTNRAVETTQRHRMPKPGMSSSWLSSYVNAATPNVPVMGSAGRDGLTPSSASVIYPSMPLQNRSFLGVQARRLRFRWKLLNEPGIKLFKKQWCRWLDLDPSFTQFCSSPIPISRTLLTQIFCEPSWAISQAPDGGENTHANAQTGSQARQPGETVDYPQRRLARPGAYGLATFHSRYEGDQESRVTAYDRFARALWAGDHALGPVALRAFFDYVPRAAEHELQHHALLSLAALQLSSPAPLLSSAPQEIDSSDTAPYVPPDVSVAARSAFQMAQEASSLARLARDRDAMPLCASLLSRSAVLSVPPSASWKGIASESQGEAQRAFPPRFPPAAVDMSSLTPFSSETLWHVAVAYRYTRILGPTHALNALMSLTWPRNPYGGRVKFTSNPSQVQGHAASRPLSVSASAPADRALLWGAHVHATYAASHRPRAPQQQKNASHVPAVSPNESVVPVNDTPTSQTAPLEPPASVGRDCVRADAFRAQVWDELGVPAVADVLLAHVLRRSSCPPVAGSAPVAPSPKLHPAAIPAALGAPPSPATTSLTWAAAETSIPFDALLESVARTAVSGQYNFALSQLLQPAVVSALPQSVYSRWAAALGGVLALQARRADRHGELEFLRSQGLLDAAPDVLSSDPREFAGLPPPTRITPNVLGRALASGAPWARSHVSTLGLADLTSLASSASVSASHSNPRQSHAITVAAAGVLGSSQLPIKAIRVLEQWPTAAAMACVDPNPEMRGSAWLDLAHVQLGLLTRDATTMYSDFAEPLPSQEALKLERSQEVGSHWTQAMDCLERARQAFSQIGCMSTNLRALGLQVSLVARRPAGTRSPEKSLAQMIDEFAELEKQLQANRVAGPSASTQRVVAIVGKVGMRYTRMSEDELPVPGSASPLDLGIPQ